MAINERHIDMCGSFNTGEKSALLKTFREVDAGTVVPQDAIAELTDSTGGTPGATLAAITAPAANATTSLTTDMTAVKNGLASLNAQLNALQDAIVASGVLTV